MAIGEASLSAPAITLDEIERRRKKDQIWARFARRPLSTISLAVLVILSLISIFAPVIVNEERVMQQALRQTFQAPNADAWFGRDELGRDAFARAVYGGRISLFVGLVGALLSTALSVLFGVLAGYFGGSIDAVIDRLIELILTIPFLVLLILAASLWRPSVWSIILILGLFGWPVLARIVRGEFISLRERDFVTAARSIGARDTSIMVGHVLPNTVAPIVVGATLSVASYVTSEAAISFLGLGIQPPTPSWGNMLTNAQSYVISAPFLAIIPGLLILITVLCVNLVGDGLRDAFDPRLRHR